jgi:hypothetical protein
MLYYDETRSVSSFFISREWVSQHWANPVTLYKLKSGGNRA